MCGSGYNQYGSKSLAGTLFIAYLYIKSVYSKHWRMRIFIWTVYNGIGGSQQDIINVPIGDCVFEVSQDNDISLDQEGQDLPSVNSAVTPAEPGNQIAADLRSFPKGNFTSNVGMQAHHQLPKGVATVPSGGLEHALRTDFNRNRNVIFGPRQASTAAASFNCSPTTQVTR